ncbi:MAG: serine hydrolase domain-containing protein [Flavobacteriaceae bacterium]
MLNTIEHIKVIFIYTLLLFIITLNSSCASGQKTPSKSEKIDELVNLYSDYGGFNGAVLVAHNGKVIYKKGLGLANMEWEISNQTDTKFMIASITKQFTALLIMQLVAENKLDLHKPISTYLPNYPKENGGKITIHHLLTHSSGLGRSTKDKKKYSKPKDMVNQFADAPLKFIPGERFLYSNSGYILLGYLIETITKKTYAEVLKDKIFTPLHMKNSGFYKHRPLIKKMSSGYNKNWGKYFNIDYSDESTAYAAGGIYSTVEDMFLWNEALNTETLLPKKYLDMIFEKHIADSEEGGYYGYGWEFKEKSIGNTGEKIETVGHSGRISGYRALYTKIQSNNAAIILLNNTSRTFLNGITKGITAILNDKSYDFPLKPLAKFMMETIEKKGIEKGIEFYKKHKDLDDYYISEKELVIEGYKLLHSGKVNDAAKVFKLSTEVFPYKDNSYDSYAEALMKLGKNTAAIKNYKKSLLLNTRNDNARKMLKKLTGKEFKEISILKTENWGKEVFTFPIRFAKEISYTGFEEAHFPKGWRKEDGPEFWSYAFVWQIDENFTLSNKQLTTDLQTYFDGLLQSVNKEKGKLLPKTIVTLNKVKGHSKFLGNLKIYDSFITKKPLKLNVSIEQLQNNYNHKTTILFRFSPKEFSDDIWQTLNKITLQNPYSEY